MMTPLVLFFAIAVGILSGCLAIASGQGLLQVYFAYSGGGMLAATASYVVIFLCDTGGVAKTPKANEQRIVNVSE